MPIPLQERFWAKVCKTATCWSWTGSLNTNGYGQLFSKHKQRPYAAHRLSWQLHFGVIPKGFFVLHRCDNPACINPAHLFLGTQAENLHDAIQKGRAPFLVLGPRLKGERNPAAKLTVEQVREIRASNLSALEIARKFGLHPRYAYLIRNRRTWKHIT